ncbi:MAG: hypothetical protein M0P31_16955 [Solirubrobacteraceae bacterium]|nr:hypothetical protein [Solirubrobacteraceae bacterium]
MRLTTESSWECIALAEATLLRVAFPTAALLLVIWLASRDALGLETAPAVAGLLSGRLAPPLRSDAAGGASRTAG